MYSVSSEEATQMKSTRRSMSRPATNRRSRATELHSHGVSDYYPGLYITYNIPLKCLKSCIKTMCAPRILNIVCSFSWPSVVDSDPLRSDTFSRIRIRIISFRIRIRAAPAPNEFEVKLLWKTGKIWLFLQKKMLSLKILTLLFYGLIRIQTDSTWKVL